MKVKLSEIKPDKEQPRKTFEDEKLQFLSESILSNGLITPIDIDEDGIIIDGERRWRAHKLAGLKEIEVRVVKLKKDKVQRLKMQLISDIQNDDVPTGERYEAIVRLWKMMSNSGPELLVSEFAKQLGIAENTVRSALDYCDFAEQEPELAKSVSPHIISETKSLPKEEREEIKKEFCDKILLKDKLFIVCFWCKIVYLFIFILKDKLTAFVIALNCASILHKILTQSLKNVIISLFCASQNKWLKELEYLKVKLMNM